MCAETAARLGEALPVYDLKADEPMAKGFRKHEWRLSLGGMAQRHSQPTQSHKVWGSTFELWTWTSSAAHGGQRHVRELNTPENNWRSTRVDVAFDFACEPETTSESIVMGWEEHLEAKGVKHGPWGRGHKQTWSWYVGGNQGGRKVRVYRKDIEDGTGERPQKGFDDEGNPNPYAMPPTMRVELQTRGEVANAMLPAVLEGRKSLCQVGAAHLQDLTGFCPSLDIGEMPYIEPAAPSDIGQRVAAMIEQYGGLLDACLTMGVDLGPLLRVRYARISERSQYRAQKVAKRAKELGSEQIATDALNALCR